MAASKWSSGVGTYEYSGDEVRKMRSHVDDPIDIYGGHTYTVGAQQQLLNTFSAGDSFGFVSETCGSTASGLPPARRMSAAERTRMRANLRKGSDIVSGYPLTNPTFLDNGDVPVGSPGLLGYTTPRTGVVAATTPPVSLAQQLEPGQLEARRFLNPVLGDAVTNVLAATAGGYAIDVPTPAQLSAPTTYILQPTSREATVIGPQGWPIPVSAAMAQPSGWYAVDTFDTSLKSKCR